MKRSWTALVCGLAFTIGAAALYAESSSTLVIEPSEMKNGEKKSFTDDGRTITVEREGDTTHVRIEAADKTEKLTITREGNQLRISRLDSEGPRSFVLGPERRRIIIDGMPMGDLDVLPKGRAFREHKMQSFFVCPKDHTTLRVPEGKGDATYKCPVDGTVMEKKRGRGFSFFFDEDSFETHEL